MIGIIGAMNQEVDQIQEKMTETSVMERAGMKFLCGKLFEKDVVAVRSGVGKVNAAVCTQILADSFRLSCIINTGIAGALKDEVNIGDIVLSSDAVQHDVDAQIFGYVPGQIPQMDILSFPADTHLIQVAAQCCRNVNPDVGVYTGRVLSGDQFISDRQKKVSLEKTFGGFCTEMEGAAIAQTAYLNKIPFIIIRAISDKADNSAGTQSELFEEQAIKHFVNLILAMVREL